MNQKKLKVLLVEDNPGDVRLIREAIKNSEYDVELYVAYDGLAATDFIRQRDEYTQAPEPDLILLDLYLPKKDGRELLDEIKSDENLKKIPVVVLTCSEAHQDIEHCYNLRANCYTNKPLDAQRFSTIVQTLEDFKFIDNFWFTMIESPGPTPEMSHVPLVNPDFLLD